MEKRVDGEKKGKSALGTAHGCCGSTYDMLSVEVNMFSVGFGRYGIGDRTPRIFSIAFTQERALQCFKEQ